jgi:drug/metabolite transporter (DMT)-like permease
MTEAWLPLALIAIFLYGSSQVAQKVSLKSLTAPNVAFLSIVLAGPISLVCLAPYIWSGGLFEIDLGTLGIGLLAAAFGQFGYYTYLEAAERGPISIVGSVTAAYPIMVIVVAIAFLDESPGWLQLGGVLMVTLAIITLSFIHGSQERAGLKLERKYIAICLVTVAFWGLWAILTKLALEDMDPLLFLGLYGIVIIPATLIYYQYRGLKLREVIPKWSVPLMIAIMSSEVVNIAFFAEINAVDQGPASIVFPLVAASPFIVIILAFFFLKERLTSVEWLLALLVVAGIVIVSTV